MLMQKRPKRNLEIELTYVGTGYHGWQIQSQGRTVQGELKKVLRLILAVQEVKTVGASRTDAGVHAHDQHVNVHVVNPIPVEKLKLALNHRLPATIRVKAVREKDMDFSARYHALGKHYAYFLFDADRVSPFVSDYFWRVRPRLNEAAMNEAARTLVGTRCFKALQAAGDKRMGSETTIYRTRVERRGDLVCFDIVGHRFLYRMVRNIVGGLVMVGQGIWTPAMFEEHLNRGDRNLMPPPAPAQGLHLFKVFYHRGGLEFVPERRIFADHLEGLNGRGSGDSDEEIPAPSA